MLKPLGKPHDSTSVLEALLGKLNIKRHSPSIRYISSDFCLSMFHLTLSNVTALFQLWQPYNDIYGKWIKGYFQKQLEALINGNTENHVLVRGMDIW